MTLNVNGLASPDKQNRLLSWLAVNNVDVAMIQEARLSRAAARMLGGKKGPEHQIKTHYSPDPEHPDAAPKGGVATLLRGRGFKVIESKSSERDPLGGCAIYTIRCKDFKIRVANLYAPASGPKQRTRFFNEVKEWAEITDICDVDLIVGDLNMIMDPRVDRSTSGARAASQEEQIAWLAMSRQLCRGEQPVDIWRTIHGQKKSWTRDDKARGSSARLDYMFMRADWIAIVRSIQTHPWEGSDHSAVKLVIDWRESRWAGTNRWRMNPKLLLSDQVKRDIKVIIKEAKWDSKAPIQDWINLKAAIASYCKLQEGRTERRGEKRRMRLVKERVKLENQPISANRQRRLKCIRATICSHDTWRARNHRFNGVARMRLYLNKPTREFYQSLPPMMTRRSQRIESLIRQDGTRISEPEEILKEAAGFYETLYTAEPTDKTAQDLLLKGVKTRVSAEHRKKLVATVGKRSIMKVISRGRAGRSPGPDGLPNEFYKCFAKCLVKKLRQVLRYYRRFGDKTGSLSRGILTLIYKKGAADNLANYRPITLLNTDFKIFSKSLADALKRAMQNVIGEHQTAYLEGRLIDDNILLSQLAIEHAKQFDEPMSLILLDQEKAFDRVSHEYLWRVMKKFGFPSKFVKALKHLYTNQEKQVYINGFWSDKIVATRNVPQGDSLSGLLYILVLEPLAIAIKDHQEIPGINAGELKVNISVYADDILVLLKDQRSGDSLMELLETHCLASNGKVNYKKSKILKIGNGPVVKVGEAEVLLPPEQVSIGGRQERYLGIPIGQEVDYTPTWLELERSLMCRIESLKKLRHDLRTRVLLSKSLLYSKIHFLARFSPVQTRILRRIEKAVNRYIWNDTTPSLNKTAATLELTEGGIGTMNLALQIRTAKACTIIKMEARPELPWVRIAVKLIAGAKYRTLHLIRERVTRPWRQHISSRTGDLPQTLQELMEAWHKCQHVFIETPPLTPCEALSIDFWYPNRSGATAKTFSCESWRKISSGINGRADFIGDIWDPIEERPCITRDLECNDSMWRARNAVIRRLTKNLSQEVLAKLKETDRSDRELFMEQRTEFCPNYATTR
jgi:exonuclease III